jgi:hypothetical protein
MLPAALLGGLTLASAGCLGSADAPDEPGDETPSVGGDTTTVQSELRRRYAWRGWSRPTTPPPGGTTGSAGATGSGGGSGTVDPPTSSTPPPSGGATDTSTGVVDSTNSGGRCPGNKAMPDGGECGPYGLTCTYDDTASHFCICSNSSSTGRQGWTCR